VSVAAAEMPVVKLFVHVKDPNNHDALIKMKSVCGDYAGMTDVVLVLGEEKKSAMRLPFKVEADDALIKKLEQLLGKECVKVQ